MARKSVAMALGVLTLGLGAITVLGMATGFHREFDRGTADAGVIALQMGLGALFLGGAVLALRLLAELWRGEPSSGWSVTAWFAAVLSLWVVWAFLRVVQYSS